MNNQEIELEGELMQICAGVEGRYVYSYLPPGSMLNGVVLANAREMFRGHGDSLTKNPSTWPEKSSDAWVFNNFCSKWVNSFHEWGGTDGMFLTMWNELDPEKSDKVILSIGGRQKPPASDTRGNVVYILFTEMPRESAVRLTEMIKSSPVLGERFYQAIFKDLDSSLDKDTGLRRIKTDNLWILDLPSVIRITKDEGGLRKGTFKKILESSVHLKLPYKVGVRD